MLPKEKEVQEALVLAKELQGQKQESNLFTQRMGPIVNEPASKNFLIKLLDVAFRSGNASRTSSYVKKLLNSSSFKGLFTPFEKALVGVFQAVGYLFPAISVPLMLRQVKAVTGPVVYFVGGQKFKNHAKKRASQNIQLNVNLIGEALIGEKEASERVEGYRNLIKDPQIDYISIKISTIYSQISSLAYEHTVEILTEKLSILYRELLHVQKQTGITKFINLDMEEYRDLPMTIDTFIQTLEKEEFKNLRAGIVLQAYLPDTLQYAIKLKNWAKKRVENGGAAIKIRVVKGANLEMEKTESSLELWPLVTVNSKKEADANYKKVLYELLNKESVTYVNVGVASHNIFDLALALNRVKKEGLEKYVDFEMLEGMADGLVKRMLSQGATVLLYTPIVKPESFNSAIAYLVRRLDEGTQDGNFLKEGIGLEVGSKNWEALEADFLDSLRIAPSLDNSPRRTQNRAVFEAEPQKSFENVANTDWVLEANRIWIKGIKNQWEKAPFDLVPVVAEPLAEKVRRTTSYKNWNGEMPWKYQLAEEEDYSSFISASSTWYDLSPTQIAESLRKVAVEIERKRGHLIAVAVSELGKTIAEVDVEVSEAIDFANYYAQCVLDYEKNIDLRRKNEGINLVLSPWNFPVAIPIGGVLASLAAGKRVILKPSTNAAATAWLTSSCLWKAGIPKSAFAFLPAEESSLDAFLAQGKTFDAVILTGSTDTAKFLLERNPYLPLYAETGGKNSTIVTALADRDQAIKNVVQSAFGNAGQKCSATSLLVLEKEVFEDQHFKALLKDATESKYFGNSWNLETAIGPLAVPVNEKIRHVLDHTPDSQWLVKPTLQGDFFLSPGIKWGITKESFEYNNELFGPILAVMCADNLKHAIDLVNGVDYGLTSGIESLDRDEINLWQSSIKAGNLYANRSTTGAIVLRQPFGGMKASSFGFGMKAGGPNYVLQFMTFEKKELKNSLKEAWDRHFSKEIDYVKLRGQHNFNRYLAPEKIVVLVDRKTKVDDLKVVEAVAAILEVPYHCFAIENVDIPNVKVLKSWEALTSELRHEVAFRSLLSEPMDAEFLKMCHAKSIHVSERPVSVSGHLEWLNYLTEQNFSFNYHRYGNLLGEVRE